MRVRMPLHKMRPPPNVQAGMNPLVLMSIAYELKTSPADHDIDPPIVVDKDGNITYGRHRWMAYYIAGRYDALVEVEECA